MQVETDVSALERVSLFKGLTHHQLQRLAEGARRVRAEAGSTLFLEGDPGSSLFVLQKGLIKIVRANDPTTTLTTLQPGAAFGELAVLNEAPRSASAVAIDVSELLEIDSQLVDDVLDEDPQAARRMLGSLAASLTVAREEVVQHNKVLDEKVQERTAQLRETQLEVIRRLGQAAEFRDDDTGLHITRMSRYCARLAHKAGMSVKDCELLLNAAPMHDIGKIGIPDSILLKPGKLEEEEFEIMKTHTTMGAELLSGSSSEVMQLAKVIAMEHHERWDGRGYPNGKAADDIEFVARITSICDVYDALTSERPYKKAWTSEDAMNLIKENAGSQFDPNLAELFLTLADDINAMRENPEILLSWRPGQEVEKPPLSSTP